jgi:hypothetical protein
MLAHAARASLRASLRRAPRPLQGRLLQQQQQQQTRAYTAPMSEMRFLLNDVWDLDKHYESIPATGGQNGECWRKTRTKHARTRTHPRDPLLMGFFSCLLLPLLRLLLPPFFVLFFSFSSFFFCLLLLLLLLRPPLFSSSFSSSSSSRCCCLSCFSVFPDSVFPERAGEEGETREARRERRDARQVVRALGKFIYPPVFFFLPFPPLSYFCHCCCCCCCCCWNLIVLTITTSSHHYHQRTLT